MKIHIVKKGDTLYELSQKYNVELDKLIAANPQIADPNVIDVGMKVKIPHDPKPVTPPADYLYKHVVHQGDSLWKLGKAWGIPLAEMIAANPQLKNPNVLMTGDIVFIPKLKQHQAQQHQQHFSNPNSNLKKDTSQIIPEAPLPVEAAPISEVPTAPVIEKPQEEVPAKVMPESKEEGKGGQEFGDLISPFHKELMPNWENPLQAEAPQPSHHLFQQYEVPATEVMSYNTGFELGKGNVWSEPELPQMPSMPMSTEMPSMPTMPMSTGMPSMPTMPMSTGMPSMPMMPMDHAMPFYAPNVNYPGLELPVATGDCGCGQPKEAHYAMHGPMGYMPNAPLQSPTHIAPFMTEPFHLCYDPCGMPIMPLFAHPFHDPFMPLHAHPGAMSPNYGGPAVSSFGMPNPWHVKDDCGCMDRAGNNEGQAENEKAVISQSENEPAANPSPKRNKKANSTHSAIRSLIKRTNRRKSRSSKKVSTSSPWLSR